MECRVLKVPDCDVMDTTVPLSIMNHHYGDQMLREPDWRPVTCAMVTIRSALTAPMWRAGP